MCRSLEVAMVELDGEPCRVRFTDEASGVLDFDGVAMGGRELLSHWFNQMSKEMVVHLLCFRADQPETFESIKKQWLLGGSVAEPVLARSEVSGEINAVRLPVHLWKGFGGWGYLECSAYFPETVQMVVDEALTADTKASWTAAPEEGAEKLLGTSEGHLWLPHETLTVADDHVPVTEETRELSALYRDQIKEGLSHLGDSCTRQHAYVRWLRCDLMGMNLTSLVKLRAWEQLQFLNVSRNRLQSLEPVGALRRLLHLNASESFTAPDALETCDMSYNMLAELGDWKVHRYLRELNLRALAGGNYISHVGNGLKGNHELRMLDLSENLILLLQNLDDLDLRTLNMAQNKLSSLRGAGVERLSKLHHLDVRHNLITSIGALKAEEAMAWCWWEVDQLASFSFLSELFLHPNPLSQLPQYRAQVLHRLPRLRQLDHYQVTPEERVKTEVIYGADVETRQEIFEQLLPEETFVDRRLMTEALISALELEQFGRNGDAGPFGCEPSSDPTFGDPPRSAGAAAGHHHRVGNQGLDGMGHWEVFRTKLQIAKFRQRVEQTRRGGFPEAAWRLAAVDGLGPMGSAEGLIAAELLKSFPLDRGCSIELENCGLADSTVARLRTTAGQAAMAVPRDGEWNKSEDVSRALTQAATERKRTAQRVKDYDEMKETTGAARGADVMGTPFRWRQLGKTWNSSWDTEPGTRDAPPEPPPLPCHPAQWRAGSTEALKALEGAQQGAAAVGGTSKQRPGEPHEVLGSVAESEPVLGVQLGVRKCFMIWEGVAPTKKFQNDFYRKKDEWQAVEEYDSGDAALGVASGQLIAHLSSWAQLGAGGFLNGSATLKPPSQFHLVKVSESSPQPRHGEDLHAALSAGLVVVEELVADGFGVGNLKLTLRLGHSFTPVCPPPCGDEMQITDFYADLDQILGSQALIWDYFQTALKWPSKPS
eukprot:Skav218929  [mRNA]  locus=scaffold678:39018:56391:+ [translate_table: standard]